ncbi:MAG: CPBP family intramembrane metalloprotease [Clostridia bacterium]|nr:CPBP family intramembrane metalloprotease [Clostridia bacterium]
MDQQQPAFSEAPRQIPVPPIDPVQTARRQIALTFLSLLFILGISSVVASVLAFVLRLRDPEILNRPGALILLSSLPSYAVSMPLSLLFFRKIPKTPPKKQKLAFPSFLGFFCIAMLLTYFGGIFGSIVNSLFGAVSGEVPTNTLDKVAEITPLWLQFLFFVVLAPIFEEIFYRKLLFDRLSTFGELPAILICGILFGLIHGNFYQFFYATAAGILFSFVYAKTGNILYTMGLHALLNFSGTILSDWLNNLTSSESEFLSRAGMLILLLFGICILLGLAFAVIYWVTKKKKIAFDAGAIPLEHRQWAAALFGNPGTWILLGVTLLPFFSDLILPMLTKFF